MKIVCQGIKGSYSYQASKFFKEKLNLKYDIEYVNSFEELFEEVEEGNFGVVPVENSNIGTIFDNYKTIINREFKIIASYFLKVDHCLASKEKDINKIKKVISHPAAIKQCLSFLKKYKLYYEDFKDTALAAEFASKNKYIAAICSEEAAKIYNLNILKREIQDNKFNYTRFFLIHKDLDYVDLTGKKGNKTSFSFEIQNRPAALFKVLVPFATYFINLTKIESFLKKGSFDYIFLLEAEISREDENFEELIKEVKFFANKLRILGTFKEYNYFK